MTNMKQLPVIGKTYHFWDDGKVSISRHYICKIERIIKPDDAVSIELNVPEWDYEKKTNKFVNKSLYDIYHDEINEYDWLYMDETDYLIEASCPQYDEFNLWFIRTKDGGWFSINVQNSWQSGRLDIDGTIFESVINDCKKYGDDPSGYYETTYEKQISNC